MRLFLLTAITMIAFAANSVLNRLAVGDGLIAPLTFALIRLAAGAGTLLMLLALRRVLRRGGLWPGLKGRFAGVAGLLVYLIGFSLAYAGLGAGAGALILFGMVQIAMFGGALYSGEAVPGLRWAGAGLAFGGLTLLLLPTAAGSISLYHAAAMVAAGLGWGVYSLAGRGAADPLAATAMNFCMALPVALFLGLFLPACPDCVTTTGPGIWLAILAGAVTTGLGYVLWYALMPKLGAARAGLAQLSVPVLAAGAGLALLAEPLTWRFVLASVLVLGGVALGMLPRAPEPDRCRIAYKQPD
jgi:drug/metabolite transporter (DMT)-like permease